MALLGDVSMSIPAADLVFAANDMRSVDNRHRLSRQSKIARCLRDPEIMESKAKMIVRALKFCPQDLLQARMLVDREVKAKKAQAASERTNLLRRQARAAEAKAKANAKAKAKAKANAKAKAMAKAKAAA